MGHSNIIEILIVKIKIDVSVLRNKKPEVDSATKLARSVC